jgi:hypothetical protein
VDKTGKVDDEAAAAAVRNPAKEEKATENGVEPAPYFAKSRQHLEKNLNLWSWDDDVELLGLSWVEFR